MSEEAAAAVSDGNADDATLGAGASISAAVVDGNDQSPVEPRRSVIS